MVNIEAYTKLQDYLRTYYNGKTASGGDEMRIRCPFCGDSSKNRKDTHMYVGINNKSQMIQYICFLCNTSGYVGRNFFKALGYTNNSQADLDIQNLTLSYNASKMNDPANKIIRSVEYSKIVNPIFFNRDAPETYKKLKRFNDRLGTNLSLDDLSRLKIIPNLLDFLNANNIHDYTRYPNIVKDLDMFFIGFLSMDNSYINLRRLVPEGKLYKAIDTRYVQYNIFGKLDNASRYYIAPTRVNTLDPQRIKIHIAEGVFDILSIYLNFRRDDYQNIYTSADGKFYLILVKYFIEVMGLINIELHIYPDNDIDDSQMYFINKTIKPFNIPLYIHRNRFAGEKDFGVRPERIQESIIRL